MNGFRELMSKNPHTPIWGLMPDKLCRALEVFSKKEFRKLPGLLVKTLLPFLGKALGVQVLSVSMTGEVTIQTPSGPMGKYAVGNGAYRDWLKDQIDSGDTSKLPVPQSVIPILKGLVASLS